MKQQKIYMKAWLDAHGRAKAVDTDEWYLDFANQLLPLVADSFIYGGREWEEDQKRVALTCALYLEDCVADGGNWRQFIHWHRKSYGRYLPFYALTEEYLPDEINREDIVFLLWAINSPVGDDFDGVENPMDADLLEFADTLYNRLDAAFELAPISDYLATDWLMETELMQKKRMPLPVALPGEKMPTNVERFLEASKGEPLLYFDSYEALKFFFVQSLKWEDEEDSLLPDLKEFGNFVVFANPKGLLIGPDVAEYFADMSHGIQNYWFIIIPVIIAAAIGIKYFAGTNPGKHVFGKIALKLPLFKKLTVKSAASMMARTLSTLMGAGVPLIEAVDIVSGVMSNIYFKEALQDAREEITIGMPLSRPLQESGLFPPMVYQMIRIGEEAGSTEEMLDKIADYYDEEVEMEIQSLMAALEPMIIIVLAIVVGGLIAACMAPMVSMYAALDNL